MDQMPNESPKCEFLVCRSAQVGSTRATPIGNFTLDLSGKVRFLSNDPDSFFNCSI